MEVFIELFLPCLSAGVERFGRFVCLFPFVQYQQKRGRDL